MASCLLFIDDIAPSKMGKLFKSKTLFGREAKIKLEPEFYGDLV